MRTLRHTIAFLALLIFLPLQAIPSKPAVEGPVNDYAGILTDREILELQRMLIDFADSTSNQICVVTVSDLEGYSEDDYAISIGRQWNVGSDDFNNGIVFLIKPKTERERGAAFIAVGRGLEEKITDLRCHRIVNETAIPRFAENDYYNGIRNSCIELMKLASELYATPARDDEYEDIASAIASIIFIIILILIIYRLSKGDNNNSHNSNRGPKGGPFIFRDWGGGSFGSGGGGFTGGFRGGFGGGSFGGGGGGGRW